MSQDEDLNSPKVPLLGWSHEFYLIVNAHNDEDARSGSNEVEELVKVKDLKEVEHWKATLDLSS